MLVLAVNTTLKNSNGENYKLGPFQFGSETQKSAWRDELDMMVADFYCDIRPIYPSLEPLLVYYDEDVPVLDAIPAPPAKNLIRAIRGQWNAGDLSLNPSVAVAA
jgi:hypothetical protein